MEVSKLLLYMLILSYAESIVNKNAKSDSDKYRLPTYMTPTHYNITLEQQGEGNIFRGICHIFVDFAILDYSVSNINLHAQKPYIEIHEVLLIEATNKFIPNPFVRSTYNKETHIHDLDFKYAISDGHYIVQIKFTSTLNDNEESFFKIFYKNIYGRKA